MYLSANIFVHFPLKVMKNHFPSIYLLVAASLLVPYPTLFGQDYRGQDISSMDLSGTDLSAAFFDGTTVFSDGTNGVNLSGTNAVLDGVNGPVDFRGVNLASVSFMNSDLSTAMFDHTTTFSAEGFDPSTGQMTQLGVNLSGTNAVLDGITGPVDFRGVNLASVSFMNSDLSTAMFDHTTTFSAEGFDPSTGQMTQLGVNLSGTNAVLDGITGPVDFRGVNLASVSFMNSDLSTAMFDHTTTFSAEGFDPSTGQMTQLGVNLSGTFRHQCGARGHYRECRFQGGQSG